MRLRQICPTAAILGGAAMIVCGWTTGARAAPKRLDCVLTDPSAPPGAEKRPVTVTFDEDSKTLTAEAGGHSYTFTKVNISYIAISGHVDDVSLGIDRSSLGIVWQRYAADKVHIEFGRCQAAKPPT